MIRAVFQQIKWMATEDLFDERQDFVWKVVLPEALIKVYMVVHSIRNKVEAEDMMAATPCGEPGRAGKRTKI